MNRLITLIALLFCTMLQGSIIIAQIPEVLIEGKIEAAAPFSSITFKFYKDYISFEELEYSTVIEKDQTFSITLPVHDATPGFVTYNNQTVPIFLERGDQLFISSKHTHFIDSLEYSQIGALRNNFLKETFVKFDREDAQLVKEGMQQKTAEDFEIFMQSYKNRKIAHRDNYLAQRDTFFSTTFAEYVDADINYWWGHQLMSYKDNHPTSHLLPIALTLPNEYYNFMEELTLNDEKALVNLNYLNYLDRYVEWRQDRISRGLLKIEGRPTKKKVLEFSRVETFAEVLADNIDVRAAAHDQNAIIGKLYRKDRVLYLRDITNDRFSHVYKGRRYQDKFVKIQMPDGQIGWVYQRGIKVFEDVLSEYVEVDLPEDYGDFIQAVKYSEFRGKVLHYAISKDIYNDINRGKRVPKSKLDNYIKVSPYIQYVQLIKEAYAARGYGQPIPLSSLRGTSADKSVTDEKIANFTKNLSALLSVADETQKNEKPKIKPKTKPVAEKVNSISKTLAPKTPVTASTSSTSKTPDLRTEIPISEPDLSSYFQNTSFRFNTNIPSGKKPELVINENPLLKKEQKHIISANTENSFLTVATPLTMPTTWELRSGRQVIELYCHPGDDLEINIQGANLYTKTSFSGQWSAENTYLLQATAKFDHINEGLERNKQDANPQVFKDWLNSVRQEKLDFFYQYTRENQLNADFIAYAEAGINYWYAFNLMNYLYEHPFLNGRPYPMEVNPVYFDFMSEISVNNDAALANKYFFNYIQEFIAYQHRKPINRDKDRYTLAEEYLTGDTKAFFQAFLLALKTKTKDKAGLSHQIDAFSKTAANPIYVEYIKEAYLDVKGIREGMKAPGFQLLDQTGKRVNLADYKGKVVLLDFWATWCGPCLDLIPVHEDLKKRFKDQNVKFVYVSMDNSSALWKNFISKKRFTGDHLISGEAMGLKSPVAIDYKIEYLPFTLLLDTDGTIVWKRTGGYSVNNLIKEMENLLK